MGPPGVSGFLPWRPRRPWEVGAEGPSNPGRCGGATNEIKRETDGDRRHLAVYMHASEGLSMAAFAAVSTVPCGHPLSETVQRPPGARTTERQLLLLLATLSLLLRCQKGKDLIDGHVGETHRRV